MDPTTGFLRRGGEGLPVRRRDGAGVRGFTLLEVLVGLTVAALALTAGFAALAFVSDRETAVDERSAEALRGATARRLLVEWLAEARPQAGRRRAVFQGFDAEDFGVETDSLTFPTSAPTPLGARITSVRLFVDRDEGTPERGLVAELREFLTDEPRLVELIPEVGALSVRYLMPVEGATGEWITGWTSNRLPLAVELTLEPARGDSLPPLLRYPIRVALEAAR